MSEEKRMVPMAVGQNTGLVLTNLEDLQRAAKLFVVSGMFPEKDGEKDLAKACVKIIAGQELGLKPFQAMRGIDIIQGTPAFRYQLVGAKIKQSGRYDFKPVEATEKIAKIQFYDRGQPVFLSIFTIEDAQKQGLAGKDGYKRMPADMLYARALTKGANKVCPEVFFGACAAPEDFGGTSGDAVIDPEAGGEMPNIIDAEVITPQQTGTLQPPRTGRKNPTPKPEQPTSVEDQSTDSATAVSSSSNTSTEDAQTAENTSSVIEIKETDKVINGTGRPLF